jgi:hypothetical protein
MSQGNEKLAQEKIKKLTQLGYYFDKQGRLQRMGMYEEDVAEGWKKGALAGGAVGGAVGGIPGAMIGAGIGAGLQHGWTKEDEKIKKKDFLELDDEAFFKRYNMSKQDFFNKYFKLKEDQLQEKQDACYHKVKSRYKVWPSAYASGALVQCRKKGADNWGNKGKK